MVPGGGGQKENGGLLWSLFKLLATSVPIDPGTSR